MKTWLKNHKTEVWIFILAFGVRFLYALIVQFYIGPHGFIAYSDAFSFYLTGAENLINHHIFSMNSHAPYLPDAYRTPIYTFFVAGFLWLHLPFFAIIFAQNILAGLMAVLIYRIGILIFNSKPIGLLAGILMSVEPMSIYWNNLLMSDYLYAFFFILAFYLFVLKKYYWFALVFGFATLTRSVGIYIFPIFLIGILWQERKSVPWRLVITTAVIFLAMLFPWALRNKIAFNTWSLSSASWYNLYGVAMKGFAEKENFTLPMPSLPANYSNPELFHYDPLNVPFYKKHFLEIFKKYPLEYTKYHISTVWISLTKNPYEYLVNYVLRPKLPGIFHGVFLMMVVVFFWLVELLWGLIYCLAFFSFFDKRYRMWFLLFFVILLIDIFTLGALGLGADMSRYELPTTPFLFLFAGAGFYFMYNRFKNVQAQ